MKLTHRGIAVAVLGCGLVALAPRSLSAAGNNYFQVYPAPYSDLRGVVDRTQNDLRMAMEIEHQKEDQRHRYQDAQGHLSTFDRHLVKGKFDKGELNKAIDSIKSILDKNVLQPSTRDALMRDLTDLRIVHDRY